MKRKSARINNFLLSYLDNEKCGDVLICLHGHFGCASMFSFMESVHNGRLLLIDQRGHGLSDHARSYTREDYINDLASMIEFEHINNPILLGHSLGGVNAYQYTAVFKDVKVLIVEDIGTQVNVTTSSF